MSDREFLIKRIEEIGLYVTDRQADQFVRFYEDLIEKNQVMNLTTITAWEDAVIKHFVDSLAIAKPGRFFDNGTRIIDVGTGAGFPGIPLAIMFPNVEIVMVDSVGKKISFIQEEILRLGMTNSTAIHGRVEELGRQPQYREKFDYCVSRAVANLSTLSEYCLPFVKKGGSFIAYKSGNCDTELENAKYAILQLSGKIKRTESYLIQKDSADDFLSRTLIEIEKTGITPIKYPRRAGTPSKSPLALT